MHPPPDNWSFSEKMSKKVSNTPEDDDWNAATILIMKQIAKTMILIHREQNKADR